MPSILADADLADYRRMERFVGKTPDMLRLVLDVLNPRAFEDFVEYGLDDPPPGRWGGSSGQQGRKSRSRKMALTCS
jgi:hypothetical protein